MIVEILDRRGAVRHRVRLRAFPATIGRGYGNDVILDDRYADPVHARVEWDGSGGLVLMDAGSVNGLRDPASGQRTRQLPVRAGLEVRLGRTTLRFVDPAVPVDPALPDAPAAAASWAGLGGTVADATAAPGQPARMVAVILATGLLLALDTWLDKTDRVRFASLVGEAMVALVAVMAWAGVWGLVNRITQHRFRFLEHLTIACVVLSAIILVNGTEEWLSFLVPQGIAWDTLSAILGLALGVWGLAAHLGRVATLTRAAQVLWSLGIVGGLVGVTTLARDERTEFRRHTASDSPLKPLGARWIPTSSSTEFLGKVDELKSEVDELNQEMTEKDETE